MGRRLVRVNPDLVAVKVNGPDADRFGTGRQGRLARLDVKAPLVKRALDLVADDGALAERARAMRTRIDAHVIAVRQVIDRVSAIVNHDARGEFTIENFGGTANIEAAHKNAREPSQWRGAGQPATVTPPSTMIV